MNKSELIQDVAQKANISKTDAAAAVNAVMESVTETLTKGESITLIGFGTFSIKERAARTGRNPRDGKPIQIAASKIPSFKAGKSLKDAVQ